MWNGHMMPSTDMFFLPPFLLVIASIILVAVALGSSRSRKPTIPALFLYAGIFAGTGAALSLAWLVGWMVWYERSTGYSAGNAPVAWIFFYGPLSVAVGELVGLAYWLRRRARGEFPANG